MAHLRARARVALDARHHDVTYDPAAGRRPGEPPPRRAAWIVFNAGLGHDAYYDSRAGHWVERYSLLDEGGNEVAHEVVHPIPWDHAAEPPVDVARILADRIRPGEVEIVCTRAHRPPRAPRRPGTVDRAAPVHPEHPARHPRRTRPVGRLKDCLGPRATVRA